MKLAFTKMHGLGNDFMVIDGVKQKFSPTKKLIQLWGDRRQGIGFDQLLLIEPAKDKNCDFTYRIFNADGNEVEQCGNGARCVMRFLQEEKLTDKNNIIVETRAGKLELKKINTHEYQVNMGLPEMDSKSCIENIECCVLSIGNPHCVLQVDNVSTAPVQELGSKLTNHSYFPEGTNVEFMQIISPEKIKLRVFERGVGETLACGSGACAAVVAGRSLNLLAETVIVELPGGHLTVKWDDPTSPVYLIGPATTVFKGTVEYD